MSGILFDEILSSICSTQWGAVVVVPLLDEDSVPSLVLLLKYGEAYSSKMNDLDFKCDNLRIG